MDGLREAAMLGEGIAVMLASRFSVDASGKARPLGASDVFPGMFGAAEQMSQEAAEVAAWEKFFNM